MTCEMVYQNEQIIELIEEHLLLINYKGLAGTLTYQQLMETPKWLKKNYFSHRS